MEGDLQPSNITNFLSRFKKLGTPNKKIKEEFIVMLLQQYKICIDDAQVRVLRNHIYIRTTPIRKAEIMQKKERILSALKEKLHLDFLDLS